MAGALAAGRLQRADQDRRGQGHRSCLPGAGVDLCPQQRVSPTSRRDAMDAETFKTTPRIEGRDFDEGCRGETQLFRVPLRIGTNVGGLLTVRSKGQGQVEVNWSSGNGSSRNCQTVKLGHLRTTDGKQVTTLTCPLCGRWRKQLFLVQKKKKGPESVSEFWFICQWCAEFSARSSSKSRGRSARGSATRSPTRSRRSASPSLALSNPWGRDHHGGSKKNVDQPHEPRPQVVSTSEYPVCSTVWRQDPSRVGMSVPCPSGPYSVSFARWSVAGSAARRAERQLPDRHLHPGVRAGAPVGSFARQLHHGRPGKAMMKQTNALKTSSCERPTPVTVKLERVDANFSRSHPPDGDEARWRKRLESAMATCSPSFVDCALIQMQSAARLPCGGTSELAVNCGLALLQAAGARNEIEAAAALRLACAHMVAMALLSRIGGAHDSDRRLLTLASAAARMLRACANETELLRRLHGGGEQRIVVEHLRVESGGQAIVSVTPS